MKLKINKNFTKISRTKIKKKIKDWCWNPNKLKDNSGILHSQHEFWGERENKEKKSTANNKQSH
jgi:hypothetical protein